MPEILSPYQKEYFRREDGSDDRSFYLQPRLLVHIDEHAIEAIKGYLRGVLPANGIVLDLMSSWRSHLPDEVRLKKVAGLGLNAVEMQENPQLHEHVVHDLNADPKLPFVDAAFDAALVTVSVQYMVRPVEVFAEVARVLRPGATFHVIYSNRMFHTKVVAIWRALADDQRATLVSSYFQNSNGWEMPETLDLSPKLGTYSDPVYVVRARRKQLSRRCP